MPPAREPLTDEQVDEALAGLPGWRREGDGLARTYSFAKHVPAAAMVVHVAAIQDEMDHHADLTLSYNQVSVAVTTHSVGGRITELDVALARRIERISAGHGAQ